MNILVTGGAGYIGGHLSHLLASLGHDLVIIDNLSTGKQDYVPAGAKFYQGDITDQVKLNEVFQDNQIDAVCHLAALLEVEESVREPQKYLEVNFVGTKILLEAMNAFGVKDIIFSSTAAVYGEPDITPIPESYEPKPNNPYGESKLLAEKILEHFANEFGFKVCVLRYFNVAGRLESTGVKDTHYNSHVLPIILEKAKRFGEVFQINGSDWPTFDGTCVRDYVHVQDIALAHVAALNKLHPGFEVFNIGTGKGTSVQELVRAVTEATGKMIALKMGDRRPGDAAITVADSKRSKEILEFVPQYSDLQAIILSSL